MKKRKNRNRGKVLFTTFILLFLWIFGIYVYNLYSNIEINESNYETEFMLSTKSEQTVEEVEEESKKIADVLEDTVSKVVGISKLKETGSSIFGTSSENELGLGTGIIVTAEGYILSNEHVTGSRYSNCYITLDNGDTYEGTVVWSDSSLDLSITKINAKNLPVIELGNSDEVRVGETVYAIGNPIGFEFRRTVTSGIISAKNRTIRIDEEESSSYMSDLIQTDAIINPGNSGGPLITPDGKVIGINTVKISSAEGISFAVPINIIKPVIESFEKTGTFSEAMLGVYAYDKAVIPYLDDTFNANLDNGIYVAEISQNGPSDNTELQVGDIIKTIDGIEIDTLNDLREYIFTKSPSDIVTLEIKRDKIEKEIKIMLGRK